MELALASSETDGELALALGKLLVLGTQKLVLKQSLEALHRPAKGWR